MKRLLNKLLIPTISSLVVIPIASCANKQIKKFNTIEILSNIEDITVAQNGEFISKPLEVKCFDQDKKEKHIDISFEINVKNSNNKPEWISINEHNELCIKGTGDVGDYQVSLIACNKQLKLYSKPEIFNVKVISERHIVPDSISLEIENDKYCMYGEETSIPINVIPFKEGTEEKYLLKDVECTIDVLEGKGIFEIGGSNYQPEIIVSNQTDKSFIGKYKLLVTATLISDPKISIAKEISINIDNIYLQYDSSCRCTFTRNSSDEGWTLSKFDKGVRAIYNLPSLIQNKPITTIGENLCQKSQVSELVQIILPNTVTTIEPNAFANETSLCSIEIPGVKYVGSNAFLNDSLAEFRKASEKPQFYYVGERAFYNCSNIKFEGQNEILWIGDYAFKNAGISTFEIGENCIFLGTECFAECSNLSSFKIYCENPPQIGGALFDKTDALKSIKVPSQNLDDYLADPYWSALGKNIEGI